MVMRNNEQIAIASGGDGYESIVGSNVVMIIPVMCSEEGRRLADGSLK